MQEYEPVILVVDDTEDNLDLLEFALKRKPVKMLRATSGQECLVIAEAKRPDIILLDIQMPEMDGFETLKRLRANPATTKIPVVFLTAQRKDAESIAAHVLRRLGDPSLDDTGYTEVIVQLTLHPDRE